MALKYNKNRRSLATAFMLCLVALFAVVATSETASADDRFESLDWSEWERLPVFHGGRMMPLGTFAGKTIADIAGKPPLDIRRSGTKEASDILPDSGAARRLQPSELLFELLIRPDQWSEVPLLPVEDPVFANDVLGGYPRSVRDNPIPRFSIDGIRNSRSFQRKWRQVSMLDIESMDDPHKKEAAQMTAKGIGEILSQSDAFSQVVYQPNAEQLLPQTATRQLMQVGQTWSRLRPSLKALTVYENSGLSDEQKTAVDGAVGLFDTAYESIQEATQVEGHARSTATIGDIEPAIVQATEAIDQILATLAADKDFEEIVDQTVQLDRELAALHMSLYDNGFGLRVVPALNAASLEKDRLASDTSQPWLSLIAILYGSDALLADYPQAEIADVRKHFENLRDIYTEKDDSSDRAERFSQAMSDFSDALRALGEEIEPRRAKLRINEIDKELIGMTAYPAPGYTDRELLYNRATPFTMSWIFALVATVAFALSYVKPIRAIMFWLALAMLFVAGGFSLFGFFLRGLIIGYCPLTNMFETVQFIIFSGVVVTIMFTIWPIMTGLIRKVSGAKGPKSGSTHGSFIENQRLFALIGASMTFLIGFLAWIAPGTIVREDIKLPAAVLRNNFWLIVHVTTIVASMFVGIIAWAISSVTLGVYLFGTARNILPPKKNGKEDLSDQSILEEDVPLSRTLSYGTYQVIKVCVILLTLGTVLGAMWGDVSWGRFWAWDPKEVWSLITLLIYMIMLHARKINWIGDYGMAVGTIVGVTSYLMAWLGVNYLLGSGLHSYGAGSEKKIIFVAIISFIICNIIYAVAAGLRLAYVRQFAESQDGKKKKAVS